MCVSKFAYAKLNGQHMAHKYKHKRKYKCKYVHEPCHNLADVNVRALMSLCVRILAALTEDNRG